MNTQGFSSRMIRVAWVTCGGLIAGSIAVAQTPLKEVTIIAKRTPHVEVVGKAPSGANIEVATLSRAVSYADLDIVSNAGATELKKRVTNTAKALCAELDKFYPRSVTLSETAACIKNATDNGMTLANAAISAKSATRTAGVTDDK